MTGQELHGLLAFIASVDGRNLTELSADAWQEIIGHLDAEACRRAVVAHFRASREWLTPAHIVDGAASFMPRVELPRSWEGPPRELLPSPERISAILGPVRELLAKGADSEPAD